MQTLPLRLRLLNAWRWLREYFWIWGFLSVIYSLTVALVLQPLVEQALKRELTLAPLWISVCALLLIPGMLERLPLPPISFRFFMPAGTFSERIWSSLGEGLGRLYLRHELRRGAAWFTIVVVVLGGSLLPVGYRAFWVLLAQLPLQRALFSIHHWRAIAVLHHPAHGAMRLMIAVTSAQLIQLGVGWVALGAVTGDFGQTWLKLGAGALGGLLAACATIFEGDSGRPWLVNFVAMTAAIVAGFLSFWSPWFVFLSIYGLLNMAGRVSGRLRSVEHLDEDHLVP